jgi:malate dehydrogenase (oxaloacetate-decarboxylating)
VKAKAVTDGMCIAAAQELARFAEERGMHERYILPKMDEWEFSQRSSCLRVEVD